MTDGFYTVEKFNNRLQVNDLRFGQADGWAKGEGDFVFVYLLDEKDGKLIVEQKPNNINTGAKMLKQFAFRIFGKVSE
jgi:hypothetical protein